MAELKGLRFNGVYKLRPSAKTYTLRYWFRGQECTAIRFRSPQDARRYFLKLKRAWEDVLAGRVPSCEHMLSW